MKSIVVKQSKHRGLGTAGKPFENITIYPAGTIIFRIINRGGNTNLLLI